MRNFITKDRGIRIKFLNVVNGQEGIVINSFTKVRGIENLQVKLNDGSDKIIAQSFSEPAKKGDRIKIRGLTWKKTE